MIVQGWRGMGYPNGTDPHYFVILSFKDRTVIKSVIKSNVVYEMCNKLCCWPGPHHQIMHYYRTQ